MSAMKYVRVLHQNQPFWGILDEDLVHLLDQAPYCAGKPNGNNVRLDSVRLLAPCEPRKIVAVGKNYLDHVKELAGDSDVPQNPILFLKPSSAIIGPRDSIRLPSCDISSRIDYEGELALVISKTASHIRASDAHAHILGYTCFNDVTARDIQQQDGQWTRAKGFDTFAPTGPWLVPDLDASDLALTTTVNDRIRQQARTSDQIWPVFELLEFISRMMTLEAGDLVTTGTPSGIGPIYSGDIVSIQIEGIGTLTNLAQ